MTSWTNRDEQLRKQEETGRFSLKTQKLFSAIENVYHKITDFESAPQIPTYETIKALRDAQMESELRKSHTLVHLDRQKSFTR